MINNIDEEVLKLIKNKVICHSSWVYIRKNGHMERSIPYEACYSSLSNTFNTGVIKELYIFMYINISKEELDNYLNFLKRVVKLNIEVCYLDDSLIVFHLPEEFLKTLKNRKALTAVLIMLRYINGEKRYYKILETFYSLKKAYPKKNQWILYMFSHVRLNQNYNTNHILTYASNQGDSFGINFPKVNRNKEEILNSVINSEKEVNISSLFSLSYTIHAIKEIKDILMDKNKDVKEAVKLYNEVVSKNKYNHLQKI